jgi:hypothetical protein
VNDSWNKAGSRFVPSPLSQIPRRDWLVFLFPPVVAAILLIAGADEAQRANVWETYAVVAAGGFAIPIVYTAYLARNGRLFLRDAKAIDESRAAIAHPRWGRFGVAAVVVAAVGVAVGSVATVLYAGLGGAIIGFWLGIAANFLRLWREEWSRS